MHGMTVFAVSVATFLGTCAAVYIWAVNRYRPAERSKPTYRVRPPAP